MPEHKEATSFIDIFTGSPYDVFENTKFICLIMSDLEEFKHLPEIPAYKGFKYLFYAGSNASGYPDVKHMQVYIRKLFNVILSAVMGAEDRSKIGNFYLLMVDENYKPKEQIEFKFNKDLEKFTYGIDLRKFFECIEKDLENETCEV